MGQRGRTRAAERRHQEGLRWAKVGAIAAVAAIPISIVVGYSASDGGSSTTTDRPAPAELHATLDVRNDATLAERDDSLELRYTDDTQPTIFVNLRNDGHTGTAIDRVTLEVNGSTNLRACDPSGGEPIRPWRAGVSLPASLDVGDTFTTDKPVAYNVGADDAGRFALRLKPDSALIDDSGSRLLRFHVKLREVSTERWLDAGDVAVVLPGVWPPDFDGSGGPLWEGPAGRQVDGYPACSEENRQALRTAVDGATVSPRIRSLVNQQR